MMQGVTSAALVLAPLACGLVLLVSGGAKLRDHGATQAAFSALDVPAWLRRPLVVRGLPYVELGLGAGLLVTWGWMLAVVGVLTLALFVAYAALVARVLRKGADVHCQCFGSLGDDRVTGGTLARNVALVLLAALATGVGLAGSGGWPLVHDFTTDDWVWLGMAVGVAATAVLVHGRSSPPDIEPADELDYLRQPIPFGLLEAEDGSRSTLRQLAAERPQLLVLLSVGCGSCHDVASKLLEWAARLAPVEIDTVFTQPLAELPDDLRPEGIRRWLDIESAVTETFGWGRPSAVLLGADGLLAGGPVAGAGKVAAFVDEIVAELSDASSQAQPVPDGSRSA